MSPLLLSMLPLLLLGSVFSTLAGGGLGIVALVVGSLFLPVQQNIALMSVLLMGIQLSKFFHFRSDAVWPIAGWYIALGIPASFVGGWVLFFIPSNFTERLLGVILLLTLLRDLVPRWRVRIQPTRELLLLSGAFNGLLGGIVGNAAVIRGQLLLAFGLSKAQFVGTSTAIALPMNVAKSSVYATQISWTHDIILLFVLGIPLMFIGVSLGKKLLQYVSTDVFERMQKTIIVLGAIRFLLF